MKKFIEEHAVEEPEEPDILPLIDGEKCMSQWSMEEELYVGYHHQGPRAGGRGGSSFVWSLLGGLVKLGIVLGGFLGLKKPFAMAYGNLVNGGDLSRCGAKV